jgi:putative hydroxymethylpyrimidine transport system substrate-binding protein
MRREFLATALIVAVVLFGGCGGSQNGGGTTGSKTAEDPAPSAAEKTMSLYAGEPSPTFPRPLSVCLDGEMSAANIAIYTASKMGYFADVGLKVDTGIPIYPRRPVPYISVYTSDIAVTQQPQAALGKEKGAPIVAVGSLVSQPTAAMIWLKRSGIRKIADLRNKTIAVPGIPYQEGMLESILERSGLDPDEVRVKRVGYRLAPALLEGEADAIFGGSWNIEGAALRKRGAKPVIKRVQELGVPGYAEDVIITRADRAAREPEVIRKFMSALARGVAAVRRNPGFAVKLLESSPHEFETSEKEKYAQVRATLPLLSLSGRLEPDQAANLLDWMQRQEMIQREPSPAELFTNRYLAHGEPRSAAG